MTQARILLVEPTASLRMVYAQLIKSAGHDVRLAADGDAALTLFHAHTPRVVMLDLSLNDRNSLDLLRDCLAVAPATRIIVLTANDSFSRAKEAMRLGAFDYLLRPFDERKFLASLDNALRDPAETDPQEPGEGETDFHGFIGISPPMQEVYHRIRSVSRSTATVFITGESGTGKEVCAQAIHDRSNRVDQPFIPLNCGAIPADLLESEVFGHLKGAFTGAIADKPGAAAAADGGTLFLDEICEMDLNLQTKLLRFLQTSTIHPVGATRPRKVDVRIICATNRDPMAEVRAARFREDLYYRLRVVPIHLPPLRERNTDILRIARSALARLRREEGSRFTDLSPAVQSLFCNLSWPGNVRQLLNVLHNVAVLHEGPLVTPDMLPTEILNPTDGPIALRRRGPGSDGDSGRGMAPAHRSEPMGLDDLVGRPMDEIERLVIEATIARCDGSVPKAARMLDVSPSTLYRKREAWAKKRAAAE